ncbi:MAG: hypothetical protein WBZ29_15225 [Methanocella sp.]
MSDQEIADPEIDVGTLLGNIERIRETIVNAAPGLQSNHHNYVRVSAIEGLVEKAINYAKSMK